MTSNEIAPDSISAALSGFPEAARQTLAHIALADSFAGVISAEAAQVLAGQTQLSTEALMLELVALARLYAHPPISSYRAGAVVLGGSGDLILGANQEFPGLALSATVHGEQAAVLNAFLHSEQTIRAIAVGGMPCGHCRQFLSEINDPALLVITPLGARPLSAMLPDAFSPAVLGNAQGMFDASRPALRLDSPDPDDLAIAALEMARRSYAPYSGNWCGVAVETADSRIVAAPYLENVAFNPSLPPLQGALAAMRMRRLDWSSIRRALLVETAGSLCSHEPATRRLLATLGDIPLEVLHV